MKERPERKTRERTSEDSGAETDDRVAEISEKANCDGDWLLLSVLLNGECCGGIVVHVCV